MQDILKRTKLLMEYDTSKTLSENEILVEQASLADDVAKGLGVLRKGLGDDVVKLSKIVDNTGKSISTMDEFIKLSKAGRVMPTQLGKVQSQLLKNANLTVAQKGTMIDNFVSQAIKKRSGVGKSVTQISDDLASKGFPKDVADDIANKVGSYWKANKSGPAAFKNQGGKLKTLKRKRTKNPNPKAADHASKIEAELARVGSKSWPAWVKWGAGLGISAIALWWFFHDNDTVVPDDIPKVEPSLDTTPVIGDKCTTYTEGSSPYEKCEKSEVIRKVQGCLNNYYGANLRLDGKFGPLTQSALIDAGFGETFTDEQVNTICKVQISPEPTPGEDLNLPTPDADENIDALNV